MQIPGWSVTSEYYFRTISGFQGADLPDLFDHGFWLQVGKFVVPRKLELLSRWSRVVGTSGTLGVEQRERGRDRGRIGVVLSDQNAKLTVDATWLNGAPINSSALDISPGAIGWLLSHADSVCILRHAIDMRSLTGVISIAQRVKRVRCNL